MFTRDNLLYVQDFFIKADPLLTVNHLEGLSDLSLY